MPPDLSELLEEVNVYLTLAFLAEMLLKIFADSFEVYISDSFNQFDGTHHHSSSSTAKQPLPPPHSLTPSTPPLSLLLHTQHRHGRGRLRPRPHRNTDADRHWPQRQRPARPPPAPRLQARALLDRAAARPSRHVQRGRPALQPLHPPPSHHLYIRAPWHEPLRPGLHAGEGLRRAAARKLRLDRPVDADRVCDCQRRELERCVGGHGGGDRCLRRPVLRRSRRGRQLCRAQLIHRDPPRRLQIRARARGWRGGRRRW